MSHNVYRDGLVHVCAEMCGTCIFRPGNPMHLRKGRVKEVVGANLERGTALVCHDTLDDDNAVCRGFYDRYETPALTLAAAMERLRFV